MRDPADHPERDQDWDNAARAETETQRLDRNWSSLLQELRVVQTGVQLLTGFLLTLPFQPLFRQQPSPFHAVYLATASASIGATILLVAPVGTHRLLFRRRRLPLLVALAHRMAVGGLLLLGVALCGVVGLIFAAVAGRAAAVAAASVTTAAFVLLWVVLPLWLRRH